jgi:hypothetical protein
MRLAFLHSFQSEWLKRRRSHAYWLVTVGAFFTPAIVIAARLVRHQGLAAAYAADGFWQVLWHDSWESMAIFFLPMAAILTTSLITQIEYRNNAWKQLHTLPLSDATLFFSKLLVVVLMLGQFLLLFDLGIWLSAVIPWALLPGVPYPSAPIPYGEFLEQTAWYFLDCLPIVAFQYLISLRSRSFLLPIGVGFMTWVAALAALPWRYAATIPYTYCMLDYLRDEPGKKAAVPPFDIHAAALVYVLVFVTVGFWLFAAKQDKS